MKELKIDYDTYNKELEKEKWSGYKLGIEVCIGVIDEHRRGTSLERLNELIPRPLSKVERVLVDRVYGVESVSPKTNKESD